MKTITNSISNEIIIKNSKFICLLYKVEKEEEIKMHIENAKKNFKDYTHLTYAWRINNKQKYNDDGEPTGTAGLPIMEVILKNDLINILAIVIRYFGGIKLGAGGLIRAYSKACIEALKLTTTEKYIIYNTYELTTTYDKLKLLNTLTKNIDIIDKIFKEEIIYKIKIEKDKDNIEKLFSNTNIKVKKL